MTATITASPSQIARYEILEELGRGAMGVVYKARDPLIDRLVALKTIGVEQTGAESAAFRQRFFREARSAGGLNHPNIVTIHDVGEAGDIAYIAMEFLQGQSLREILDSGTVLPAAQIGDIAAQVADGLAFAHARSIVHRDIKPANIMVLANGVVKITDFGIAQLPSGSRTIAGTVFGSPKYISPERVRGHLVDGRSDIFSLGAVLYEMLTGLPPFVGADLNTLLYQILSVMPVAPSRHNRNIALAFDLIVATALAKNPADRYRDARDMASDLRHFAEPRVSEPLPTAPREQVIPDAPSRGEGDRTLRGGTTQPETMPDAMVPMLEEAAPTVSTQHAIPLPWRRASFFAVPAVVLALHSGAILFPREDVRPAIGTAGSADAAPESKTGSQGTLENPRLAEAPSQTRTDIAGTTLRAPQVPQLQAPAQESPMPAKVPAAAAAPAREPSAAAAPAKELIAASPATAKPLIALGLAIAPWGEVFVNGKKVGNSPPLTEVKLAPGQYTIEIRNTTFDAYRETIDLQNKANARIRHKFQ